MTLTEDNIMWTFLIKIVRKMQKVSVERIICGFYTVLDEDFILFILLSPPVWIFRLDKWRIQLQSQFQIQEKYQIFCPPNQKKQLVRVIYELIPTFVSLDRRERGWCQGL